MSKISELSNKRKAQRLDCLVPVDGQQGGVFSNVRTVDFSKGGIGILSERKIPLNEEIAIEIDFGIDEPPVLVLGKVRWVRPIPGKEGIFRVGLSFETVIQGGQTRLSRYFRDFE